MKTTYFYLILFSFIIFILFLYYFYFIFIILVFCEGSGGFRGVPGGSGGFRGVPGRFRVGSVWFRGFRVVPAGSGRFRVGSAFYIHPTPQKVYIKNKGPWY